MSHPSTKKLKGQGRLKKSPQNITSDGSSLIVSRMILFGQFIPSNDPRRFPAHFLQFEREFNKRPPPSHDWTETHGPLLVDFLSQDLGLIETNLSGYTFTLNDIMTGLYSVSIDQFLQILMAFNSSEFDKIDLKVSNVRAKELTWKAHLFDSIFKRIPAALNRMKNKNGDLYFVSMASNFLDECYRAECKKLLETAAMKVLEREGSPTKK